MHAYTRPMIISQMGEASQQCTALERLPLKPTASGATYTEAWLQHLLHDHPTLIPVEDVEPALSPLTPVCVELPTRSGGYIDNLLISEKGGIALVEAKLWRNPEARRKVIAQIIEYARDLAGWSYAEFESAIRLARCEPGLSLFRLVCGEEADDQAEARFIDAVSRNLRNGRLLLIIAGDGIQENIEELADFLQHHVGLHFTLVLVEIALWRNPVGGQVFAQPRIVARTKEIERAVIRLEAGVAIAPEQISAAPASTRPTTLSAEAYWEQLGTAVPGLPDRLKAFLAEAETLGVFGDIRRSLSLKWRSPDGRDFNLGLIDLQGRIATDYANDSASRIGRLDLGHAYGEALASLVPGAAVRQTPAPIGWRVVLDGENLPVARLLDHKEAWLNAIADYTRRLGETIDG